MSSTVAHPAGRNAVDNTWVRQHLPSLQTQVNGQPAAFLDGPAGTQVPQQVIDAIQKYLLHDNANTCGAFATSRRNDAMIVRAMEKIGPRLGPAGDHGLVAPTGGEGSTSISVIVQQIFLYGVDDLLGNLGACGTVQKGGWLSVHLRLQGRKLLAHPSGVQCFSSRGVRNC